MRVAHLPMRRRVWPNSRLSPVRRFAERGGVTGASQDRDSSRYSDHKAQIVRSERSRGQLVMTARRSCSTLVVFVGHRTLAVGRTDEWSVQNQRRHNAIAIIPADTANIAALTATKPSNPIRGMGVSKLIPKMPATAPTRPVMTVMMVSAFSSELSFRLDQRSTNALAGTAVPSDPRPTILNHQPNSRQA